jgi:hypothetical protein
MTVICACHEPGVGTWIGSDSIATRDDMAWSQGFKWLRRGDRAISCAGTHYLFNLFEANAETLLAPDITRLAMAQAVKSICTDAGYKFANEEGCPPKASIWTLYATAQAAFLIAGDFGSMEFPPMTFIADGSGGQVAEGAFHVAKKFNTVENAMKIAIEAAIDLTITCGSPVHVDLLRSA